MVMRARVGTAGLKARALQHILGLRQVGHVHVALSCDSSYAFVLHALVNMQELGQLDSSSF